LHPYYFPALGPSFLGDCLRCAYLEAAFYATAMKQVQAARFAWIAAEIYLGSHGIVTGAAYPGRAIQ